MLIYYAKYLWHENAVRIERTAYTFSSILLMYYTHGAFFWEEDTVDFPMVARLRKMWHFVTATHTKTSRHCTFLLNGGMNVRATFNKQNSQRRQTKKKSCSFLFFPFVSFLRACQIITCVVIAQVKIMCVTWLQFKSTNTHSSSRPSSHLAAVRVTVINSSGENVVYLAEKVRVLRQKSSVLFRSDKYVLRPYFFSSEAILK